MSRLGYSGVDMLGWVNAGWREAGYGLRGARSCAEVMINTPSFLPDGQRLLHFRRPGGV